MQDFAITVPPPSNIGSLDLNGLKTQTPFWMERLNEIKGFSMTLYESLRDVTDYLLRCLYFLSKEAVQRVNSKNCNYHVLQSRVRFAKYSYRIVSQKIISSRLPAIGNFSVAKFGCCSFCHQFITRYWKFLCGEIWLLLARFLVTLLLVTHYSPLLILVTPDKMTVNSNPDTLECFIFNFLYFNFNVFLSVC